MSMPDFVGAIVGFVLTLAVFSYIWGDNAVFRMASHLFIGVAAGYVATAVLDSVILHQLIFPFVDGDRNAMIFAILFLVLSVLMLAKISPRLEKLGSPAVAYLTGVGAAAAIGGAVMGTIFPQSAATMQVFNVHSNPLNAMIVLAGTLTTVMYFHFGIRNKPRQEEEEHKNEPPGWMESLSDIGRVFIAIAFAALFAGVYLAAATALVERVAFLWNFVKDLIF